VPPASERGVGLPRSVDRVFERALAKEPGERYATPGALVRDLADALEEAERTRVLPAPVPVEATAATRRMTREPSRAGAPPPQRRGRSWLPLAAGLALIAALLGGVVFAATLGNGDGEPEAEPQTEREITVTEVQEGTTVVQTETIVEDPQPPPAPPPSPPPPQGGGTVSMAEARELTDQATAAMRDGDYETAVELAEQALTRLSRTGDIYEAYASYNAGRSYAELGDCERALPLLDRSQEVQGQRREIDEARATCS
jgi:tetratricopeptide (TPR) repeat protein